MSSGYRRYTWAALVSVAALLSGAGCAMRPAASTAQSLAVRWAFQPGDDPVWARPEFDDRAWARLEVPGSWRRQGFDDLVGIAWYRLTVPSRWPSDAALGVTLGKIDSAYEFFVGGRAVGGVGRLPPEAQMEYDRHRTYSVPPQARNPDGSITLAMRVWRNPSKISTAAGPVEGPFEIGPLVELIERDKLVEARELALVFIFITVAVVHLALRLRLGEGDEYLWFGLMAALAATYGFLRTQWKYLVIDDFVVLKRIEHVVLWLIPVVLVQFLWVFFRAPHPRWVRGMQVVMIGGSVIVGLAPGLLTALALLPIVQFSTVPLTLGALVLVVQQWRVRGRDASLVAAGMAILSVTIVHDALVDRNLIVDARVAQYGFAMLVVGMSVTLGNRFQRAIRERDALTRDLESRVQSRTEELNDAYRKMEQLASYDGLTGVLNRRALTDRAQNELARARRHKTPFALALADVDTFKRINDSAGHTAGDAVLRELARRLTASVRASDDVGRWGGEEFLVLVPGAAPQEAVSAGERMRDQIAATPFVLPDGSKCTVTISVGLVAVDGTIADALDLEKLIERADRALYRAKAEGRNTVRLD